MARKQTVYLALLRGINVGGHATVSMAALKACFEQLGYTQVQTFINSGNVVFVAAGSTRALEKTIEGALVRTFGFDITVVVRSLTEIDRLMEHLPDSWASPGEQKCNVIFLHHTVDSPRLLAELKPKPGIEELHYHSGVLFWSAQTSNLTKSNMLKVSRLPVYKAMTVRTLSTVRKLHGMMQTAAAV